jgi:hypothetical protein
VVEFIYLASSWHTYVCVCVCVWVGVLDMLSLMFVTHIQVWFARMCAKNGSLFLLVYLRR